MAMTCFVATETCCWVSGITVASTIDAQLLRCVKPTDQAKDDLKVPYNKEVAPQLTKDASK